MKVKTKILSSIAVGALALGCFALTGCGGNAVNEYKKAFEESELAQQGYVEFTSYTSSYLGYLFEGPWKVTSFEGEMSTQGNHVQTEICNFTATIENEYLKTEVHMAGGKSQSDGEYFFTPTSQTVVTPIKAPKMIQYGGFDFDEVTLETADNGDSIAVYSIDKTVENWFGTTTLKGTQEAHFISKPKDKTSGVVEINWSLQADNVDAEINLSDSLQGVYTFADGEYKELEDSPGTLKNIEIKNVSGNTFTAVVNYAVANKSTVSGWIRINYDPYVGDHSVEIPVEVEVAPSPSYIGLRDEDKDWLGINGLYYPCRYEEASDDAQIPGPGGIKIDSLTLVLTSEEDSLFFVKMHTNVRGIQFSSVSQLITKE